MEDAPRCEHGLGVRAGQAGVTAEHLPRDRSSGGVSSLGAQEGDA